MKYTLGIILGLSLVGQAHALSCLRPNIANGFNWAGDQDYNFVVAFGTIKNLGELPPTKNAAKLRSANLPVPKGYDAELRARFLSSDGLESEVTLDIKVQEICQSAWCGIFPDENREMVAILKQIENTLVLESTPCQTTFQYEPKPIVQKVLQNCITRGQCSDRQVMRLVE